MDRSLRVYTSPTAWVANGYSAALETWIGVGEPGKLAATMREPIPLAERKLDWIFIGFFLINFGFITYIVDIEQLVIADPSSFEYPIWPPPILVDLVHWWGESFDPVLLARPAWWRATIWIDAILFGPFYAAALYAFITAKDWIRVPCFLWAGLMFANVTIICFEEMIGTTPTPARAIVLMANAAWWTFPMFLTWRMWAAGEHPFTRETGEKTA